jgi:hypothetical protein
MESINQTCGRTLPNLADCLYITTNRCVCKHYTASRPVLLLFCNTLEKSKSKSTEESTSLQVKSIQVVLKNCNALLLLRYRTTLVKVTKFCSSQTGTPVTVLGQYIDHVKPGLRTFTPATVHGEPVAVLRWGRGGTGPPNVGQAPPQIFEQPNFFLETGNQEIIELSILSHVACYLTWFVTPLYLLHMKSFKFHIKSGDSDRWGWAEGRDASSTC